MNAKATNYDAKTKTFGHNHLQCKGCYASATYLARKHAWMQANVLVEYSYLPSSVEVSSPFPYTNVSYIPSSVTGNKSCIISDSGSVVDCTDT